MELRLLDSLYFLTSFDDLQKRTGISSDLLERMLDSLIRGGYVHQFQRTAQSLIPRQMATPDPSLFRSSWFVATRKGLLAHWEQA